jgi:hypothetical protein
VLSLQPKREVVRIGSARVSSPWMTSSGERERRRSGAPSEREPVTPDIQHVSSIVSSTQARVLELIDVTERDWR